MKLVYVADPMCSWCYGFGKQLSIVMKALPEIQLSIVVGGVRAGSTELLDDNGKNFRLSHWERVEAASGLPFNREAFIARQGFVYDTEPVCRAVVTARRLAPKGPLLDVFRALQHAFYVDGEDTTDSVSLARITAKALGLAGFAISAATVLDEFNAQATMIETQADFAKARVLGVTSFPSLMLFNNGVLSSVAPGYIGADELLERLERHLASLAV
ncbi:MAG: DsbA family protein [Pseudomonas sp.]|nr:DsbA family protein [Pseudomonas sp.]